MSKQLDMKVCSRCKIDKINSDFRVRKDKRQSPVLVYLNNTCKSCDTSIQKKRYEIKKNDPKFMAQNSQRAKAYCIRTGAAKKRWLKNKHDPQYAIQLNAWREENKDRVKSMQKDRSKKHNERIINEISDSYCRSKLKCQNRIFRERPELITGQIIETKRILIKLKREINYGTAKKRPII